MSDGFRHRVRVQYIDTDKGGVVHHAAYLRFLEAARVELMRARGIDYRAFEIDERKGIPVAEAHLRYKRPCFFDDLLEIETWVSVCNRAKLRFDYRVWRGEELVLTGEITCACVDMDRMKICSMHPRFREVFG
ncbi:MAG: acyl-CoA thioesterase [Myxococcales bacterium]|nr:acyl-CoA thioesterase [Myxococcales bacterium]